MHLTNANVLNLTNKGDCARESPIVNDIIRSSSLDLAKYQHQQLIREAERSRLIAEARDGKLSNFARFVRLPIGRTIVATGRRIQGRAAVQETEAVNASAALKLAR